MGEKPQAVPASLVAIAAVVFAEGRVVTVYVFKATAVRDSHHSLFAWACSQLIGRA